MTEIIAADIGGTNARFARARVEAGKPPVLGEIHRYRTGEFPGLAACWHAFRADAGEALPDRMSIAVAGAIRDGGVRLTNSTWTIRTDGLAGELGLAEVRVINDFAAVAHAIPDLPPERLELLFGPARPLPRDGAVTVIGPGTGLGVAAILFDGGRPHVLPTEGGHIGYAPTDEVDCAILAVLHREYGRVSAERIVSGPGLANLCRALATISGGAPPPATPDRELWTAAITGTDQLARHALERLCLAYGAVAGDLALAHGPHHVVLAGGLTARMRGFLVEESGFYGRFIAKGRYEGLMRAIPVRYANHPEIGLFGAAAAWKRWESAAQLA